LVLIVMFLPRGLVGLFGAPGKALALRRWWGRRDG
jgi:hypothetical protein